MNKLEIGTKIRIREGLKEGYWDCVVDTMLEYRGKVATIMSYEGQRFTQSHMYKIDIDGGVWYWSDTTFEVIKHVSIWRKLWRSLM